MSTGLFSSSPVSGQGPVKLRMVHGGGGLRKDGEHSSLVDLTTMKSSQFPQDPILETLHSSAYVVDEADVARCIVLDVGGARFRVRRDRLCAHSVRIRGILSQSATSISTRVRSQSEASDRTKVGAASEAMSDTGYESETGHEITGIRKVEGSVHGDKVADGEHMIAHQFGADQFSAGIQDQNVKDVAFELAIEGIDPADFREMLGAMDDAMSVSVRPPVAFRS